MNKSQKYMHGIGIHAAVLIRLHRVQLLWLEFFFPKPPQSGVGLVSKQADNIFSVHLSHVS